MHYDKDPNTNHSIDISLFAVGTYLEYFDREGNKNFITIRDT